MSLDEHTQVNDLVTSDPEAESKPGESATFQPPKDNQIDIVDTIKEFIDDRGNTNYIGLVDALATAIREAIPKESTNRREFLMLSDKGFTEDEIYKATTMRQAGHDRAIKLFVEALRGIGLDI